MGMIKENIEAINRSKDAITEKAGRKAETFCWLRLPKPEARMKSTKP